MTRTTIQETLEKTGILVIDGSMSTALEQLGCDLNDSLWTATALDRQPELVEKVHENYFAAGADCGITCSYQATIPGLMAKGHTLAEAEGLITRSVELFLEARERWWQRSGREEGRAWPLCLAGIGPYGAYLADGSEYRGNYGVGDDVLRDFHRRRMELLWQAGADVLLIETQPSLAEARIELSIAEELGAEAWVSFSCRDGSHINEGDRIRDCAAELEKRYPQLRMIGVNCTPPQFVEHLIGELRMTPPPRPGTAAGTAWPSGTTPAGGCVRAPAPWAAAAGQWTATFRRWSKPGSCSGSWGEMRLCPGA